MIYLFEALYTGWPKRIGGQDSRQSRSWLEGSFAEPAKKERRMSKPHPSMALTLDLDEAIVDHELRLRSTAATLIWERPWCAPTRRATASW